MSTLTPSVPLEPDVIRDQAAYLRECLPAKFHDFFDRLCLTAITAPASEIGTPQSKADPIADLCAHIKGSIRFCDHGYIHVTCGDCQRRN